METIDIVVETPGGSPQKFNYDPKMGFFRLKKMLPVGMVFPYDFGFIPGTKGEDGDPLDVLIVAEFSSFPGCIISCRLIGGIKAIQSEKGKEDIRNDRFIAIPVQSRAYGHLWEITDLPEQILKETEDFFVNYNRVEGKVFKPLGIMNAQEAIKIIERQKQVEK